MQHIAREGRSTYRRKGKHLSVCVSLQKFTDWVSNCFKTLLKSWCNNMYSKRKTGIFCKDWSVWLWNELMLSSLALPALLFCSALVSQSVYLQFLLLLVLVFVSQFSTRRLLLQDLQNVVCCEKQCKGRKGGVDDFSWTFSQVLYLQFVIMCLSFFK